MIAYSTNSPHSVESKGLLTHSKDLATATYESSQKRSTLFLYITILSKSRSSNLSPSLRMTDRNFGRIFDYLHGATSPAHHTLVHDVMLTL